MKANVGYETCDPDGHQIVFRYKLKLFLLSSLTSFLSTQMNWSSQEKAKNTKPK